VEKPKELDPFLLLALLNTPIVRRQMRAKQFTRDIIDTLGKRLFDIVLPIPKDASLCGHIAMVTHEVIDTRARLRDRSKTIVLGVEGIDGSSDEYHTVLENI
jgi:type I restriction enzyme M protein